ncbi:hypothetical protein CYMTET_15772 [Cymbomonas tetramitiformis]|uniref:Uncharacterized protein n=1 Tax=Cymbomonas tetramitiformis TaxID=36881 RepID=A0AAE0L8M9_9CHLO|nr:hypothetical protein CYMTET_15772 [Cymbomonas tetramitiformis]
MTFGLMQEMVNAVGSPGAGATITPTAATGVTNTLDGAVRAGVLNAGEGPQAANPAARALDTMGAMGDTLAAAMAQGEDPMELAAETLTMRVQRADLADPESSAYAAPLLSGQASVVLPSSLGAAVGAGSEGITIKLLTSTLDPHLNLTAANGSSAPHLRRALAVAAGAEAAATVTTVSLQRADGSEVAVSGLEEAITFDLPMGEEGANASSASASSAEAAQATSVQCAFWDPSSEQYRGEGCASMPVPAPVGVELYWRTLNGTEVAGDLRRMWAVDPVGSRWFLEGCEESFEAVFPEYLGADAGYRKYVGEGCVAADPENNASCWWQWESQAFLGAGCARGTHVHCLCTHLTDFKAVMAETIRPPPPGATISTSDMQSMTASDVADSVVLLGVVAGIMVAAVVLAIVSNHQQSKAKFAVFRALMCHKGTDALWFRPVGGLWTWSLTVQPSALPPGPPLPTPPGRDLHRPQSRATSDASRCMRGLGACHACAARSRHRPPHSSAADAEGRHLRDASAASPAACASAGPANLAKGRAPPLPALRALPGVQRGGARGGRGRVQEEELYGGGCRLMPALQEEDAKRSTLPIVRKLALRKEGLLKFQSRCTLPVRMSDRRAPDQSRHSSPGKSQSDPHDGHHGVRPTSTRPPAASPRVPELLHERSSFGNGGQSEQQGTSDGSDGSSHACASLVIVEEYDEDVHATSTPFPDAGGGNMMEPMEGPLSFGNGRRRGGRRGHHPRADEIENISLASISLGGHMDEFRGGVHPAPEHFAAARPLVHSSGSLVNTGGDFPDLLPNTRHTALPGDNEWDGDMIINMLLPPEETAPTAGGVAEATEGSGNLQDLWAEKDAPDQLTTLMDQPDLLMDAGALGRCGMLAPVPATPPSAEIGPAPDTWTFKLRQQSAFRLNQSQEMLMYIQPELEQKTTTKSSGRGSRARYVVASSDSLFVMGSIKPKPPQRSRHTHVEIGTRTAMQIALVEPEFRLACEGGDDDFQGEPGGSGSGSGGAAEEGSEQAAEQEALELDSAQERWTFLHDYRRFFLQVLYKERIEDLGSSAFLCKAVGIELSQLLLCVPVDYIKDSSTHRQKVTSKMSKILQTKPPSKKLVTARKPRRELHGKKAANVKPSATPTKKIHLSSWDLSQLSTERLLGTALVHAFLLQNPFLVDKLVAEHIRPATKMPWQGTSTSKFRVYKRIFQELLAECHQSGWYHASSLFKLVFLQSDNGSFELSQDLANTLRVPPTCLGPPSREPNESVADTTALTFDLNALKEAMPPSLVARIGMAADGDQEDVERVWGTLLALELCHTLGLNWIKNPEEHPYQRTTLASDAADWLSDCGERLDLVRALPLFREKAKKAVKLWQDAHVARLEELRRGQPSTYSRSSVLAVASVSHWKVLRLQLRKAALFLALSHPLVAIYLVPPTAAFTRAERILTQANVFIVMLSVTIAAYYSRVVTCCTQLQSFVDCPDVGRFSSCLGYSSCGELHQARMDEFFPAELAEEAFSCHAFPDSSWVGKVQGALLINAVLIPLNVLLMALFSLAGVGGSRPGCLTRNVVERTAKLMNANESVILVNVVVVAYALVYESALFVKMTALLFMSAFSVMFKPVARVAAALKYVMRWVYTFVVACSESFWKRVSASHHPWARLLAPGEPASPFQDPIDKYGIEIEGMLSKGSDLLAYIFLTTMWGMSIWILLTYGVLIREIMGAEEERKLILTWFECLLLEQFGLTAVRLVIVRTIGKTIHSSINRFVAGGNAVSTMEWYESYITGNLILQYMPQDGDTFFGGTAI